MENKTTLNKPLSSAGKKVDDSYENKLNIGGVNLQEMDSMLTEKQQSFKSKVWSLPKMEGLVHSDPILSAEFQKMSKDGKEKYGYHHNETIMNMLFNKYVTNNQKYRQKYLNAVPVDKKRRDASGIEALEKKGEEKMKKVKTSKNEMYDVDEADASASGSYNQGLDFNGKNNTAKNNVYDETDLNEDEEFLDETTTSASSGQYSTPHAFAKKGSKERFSNTPAWDGGEIVSESYLVNQNRFKKLYNEINESIIDGTPDTMAMKRNGGGMSNFSESEDEIFENDGERKKNKNCRKGEKPVAGKIAGEKGSCEKIDKDNKTKETPNDKPKVKDTKRDVNYFNKKWVDERDKKYNSSYKDTKNMKKEKQPEMKVNEDKRSSALVQMDRLHKDNVKAFKDDKSNNIGDILNSELRAKEEIEEVPNNPYKYGEDIEKEKLKQNGFNSFDNVGNSTNDNNKEIPKRNATDEESDQIMKDRGLGMQDIVYDNEPDERFEERMKSDMGEDIYKQREEKMKYRSEAPMYNKETQPTDKGNKNLQYDKYIKENQSVSAKYFNEFNKRKVISFNINEAIDSEKPEGVKLNFDGMGNTYTSKVTENAQMRNLMDSFNYYLNGNKIIRVPSGRQSLTEGVKTKNPINEQIQKMMRLSGYKPSEYVDTTKIKRDAKFNFN